MALRKYRKALRYLDVCWEKEGVDEGRHIYVVFDTFPKSLDLLPKSLHNLLMFFPSIFLFFFGTFGIWGLSREESSIKKDKIPNIH